MFRSKILAFAMASLSFALAPALVGAAAEKTTSELQLKTQRSDYLQGRIRVGHQAGYGDNR